MEPSLEVVGEMKENEMTGKAEEKPRKSIQRNKRRRGVLNLKRFVGQVVRRFLRERRQRGKETTKMPATMVDESPENTGGEETDTGKFFIFFT